MPVVRTRKRSITRSEISYTRPRGETAYEQRKKEMTEVGEKAEPQMKQKLEEKEKLVSELAKVRAANLNDETKANMIDALERLIDQTIQEFDQLQEETKEEMDSIAVALKEDMETDISELQRAEGDLSRLSAELRDADLAQALRETQQQKDRFENILRSAAEDYQKLAKKFNEYSSQMHSREIG